jgi:hypothetical protein
MSYANVVATMALVFAMGGTAVAAKHYLITSTSQIKPSVLKKLKGNTGAKGATGVQGATGQGAAGAAGAQGPVGPEGRQGPEGPGAVLVSVSVAAGSTEPLFTYGGVSLQASCKEEGGKGIAVVEAKGLAVALTGPQTQTRAQSTTVNEPEIVNFTAPEDATYYGLRGVEFTTEANKFYYAAMSDQLTMVPTGTGASAFHLDLFEYVHQDTVGKILPCVFKAAYYPLAS